MTGDSTNQIQQITDTALKAVIFLLGARSRSQKREKKGKKKRGKIVFPYGNLLVGVFSIQRGGLVEKATEAGCEPVPNVTSLFLRNSRKKKERVNHS